MSIENYLTLVPIFEKEDNPFLGDIHKNEKATKENLEFIQDLVYDFKRGGCDFLIKLKNTQKYVGILHLFDYSLETFLDIPLRCTLGYAIGVSFRQKYYATEAMKHLIAYSFEHHGKKRFLVYTATENEVSN